MDEGSFPIVYHDVETSWWWFRCGNLDFEKKSESSRVFCLAGIERVGGGLNTFLDPSYQTFLASSAADVAMRVRSLPPSPTSLNGAGVLSLPPLPYPRCPADFRPQRCASLWYRNDHEHHGHSSLATHKAPYSHLNMQDKSYL